MSVGEGAALGGPAAGEATKAAAAQPTAATDLPPTKFELLKAASGHLKEPLATEL